MNWKEYIFKLRSTDPTSSYGFHEPASEAILEKLKSEFNLSELPKELEDLYRQTNGIDDKATIENIGEITIGMFIWTVEEVIETNKMFRNEPIFKDVNMSFDQLLFFSDAGNGDLFGMVTLNGKFERNDIFCWDHENDSRNWVAPNLKTFIDWGFEEKINE